MTGPNGPATGAELRVRDVTVRFGATAVLDDVRVTVGPGEVVALLGPSGSGKSTLLRVIAGLLVPDAGTVAIDGVDVTDTATHRRGVGMVFQDEQLFDHLDVAANVGFGLRMQGRPARERTARVAALLDLVGLPGFERRAVTELSGGEAKRVALARSLAPAPRVLLLDEPLTGLDRELHDRLALDLAIILRAESTTALLVTHDRDEATTVADRVVTIADLMDGAGPPVVEAVPVDDVIGLRRDVLRRGTPSDDPTFDADHEPATVHLAVRDPDGSVIATSTWLERESPDRPGVAALQLRGMAVADRARRQGLGAVLIDAGVDLARSRGLGLLWANARDTALDFYLAQGFTIAGEGFVSSDTQLPHHRILRAI